MTEETYDGPSLKLRLRPNPDGTRAWELTVAAADHSGTRQLAYRAMGPSTEKITDFDLAVRDEHRDVWTTMPTNHRTDLRDLIPQLVAGAAHLVDLAAKQSARRD